MCTNLHYIYNKYIKKRVLVNCGKCEACRQQKADAVAFRIKHSCPSDYVQLFVTLTYNNDSLPVVLKDDIKEFSYVPVYRGSSGIKIGEVYVGELPYQFNPSLTPSPRHFKDNRYLGVCFFKDLQNFFKRLRITLQRKYNYDKSFKYAAFTEYGETYFRPHSHIVLTVPKADIETFRSCIIACWPFGGYDRTARGIEVARHCADYVASYVNCGSALPKVLQIPAFRQRHSYSQHYGISYTEFQVQNICEKIDKGALVYHRASGVGNSGFDSVCIPEYVVNRHFPKLKGYSQIDSQTLYCILLRPTLCKEFFDKKYLFGERIEENRYSIEDVRSLVVRLNNSYEKFANSFLSIGRRVNYFDYIHYYISAWKCYYTTQLRLFYASQESDVNNDLANYYDNINEVLTGVVRCDYADLLSRHLDDFVNYNNYPMRVLQHDKQVTRYRLKTKQRKVSNMIHQKYYDDI